MTKSSLGPVRRRETVVEGGLRSEIRKSCSLKLHSAYPPAHPPSHSSGCSLPLLPVLYVWRDDPGLSSNLDSEAGTLARSKRVRLLHSGRVSAHGLGLATQLSHWLYLPNRWSTVGGPARLHRRSAAPLCHRLPPACSAVLTPRGVPPAESDQLAWAGPGRGSEAAGGRVQHHERQARGAHTAPRPQRRGPQKGGRGLGGDVEVATG